MSRGFYPEVVTGAWRSGQSPSARANANVGAVGAVGQLHAVFDPVLVHRAKMKGEDIVGKLEVCDVVPRADAAKKECPVIRTRRRPQMISLSCARAGWHRSFAGGAETHTSTSLKHLSQLWSRPGSPMQPDWSLRVTQSRQFLILVERICTLRKRGTRAWSFSRPHARRHACLARGKLRNALCGTRPAAAYLGDELNEVLVSCVHVVGDCVALLLP